LTNDCEKAVGSVESVVISGLFSTEKKIAFATIFRIWHGWTTPGNAAAYERLVQEEVFAIIADKKIAGCRGIDLLRRRAGDEVEFVTIMRFDSLANVKAFVGEDYERSFVPPQARAVLKRFDDGSQHYEHIRHIDYADAQG
jgi:antibiotic biosynthesis monooxygenase (ABM) superfamily enzyme